MKLTDCSKNLKNELTNIRENTVVILHGEKIYQYKTVYSLLSKLLNKEYESEYVFSLLSDNGKEEIKKLRTLNTEKKGYTWNKKVMNKMMKETEKAINALDKTMISYNEMQEMLKPIGYARVKSTGIKVQEWSNAEKTMYYTKKSHQKLFIKNILIVNNTFAKEDIENAIKNM